jgi:hypothetical protein
MTLTKLPEILIPQLYIKMIVKMKLCICIHMYVYFYTSPISEEENLCSVFFTGFGKNCPDLEVILFI